MDLFKAIIVIALLVALVIGSPILTGWLASGMVGAEYELTWATWLYAFAFNLLVVGGSSTSSK